jgi:VanZ family protein
MIDMNVSTQARLAPSLFAIAFFTAAIVVVTLVPFEFRWLSSATMPVVRIYKSDVAQNILLFAPLGFALAASRRLSLWQAVMCGVLLSSCVEFAQLSIVGRTSNVIDVVTNGTGTLVGFVCAGWLLRGRAGDRVFAVMLLPLCWIIAMRSIHEPAFSFLVLPVILIGLLHWPLAWLYQGAWLTAALLPLLYASREHVLMRVGGLPFTLGMIPIGLAGCIALAMPWLRFDRWVQAAVLTAVLVIFAASDVVWFLAQGAGLQWTAHMHLHWAGEATCFAVLVYFWWLARRT